MRYAWVVLSCLFLSDFLLPMTSSQIVLMLPPRTSFDPLRRMLRLFMRMTLLMRRVRQSQQMTINPVVLFMRDEEGQQTSARERTCLEYLLCRTTNQNKMGNNGLSAAVNMGSFMTDNFLTASVNGQQNIQLSLNGRQNTRCGQNPCGLSGTELSQTVNRLKIFRGLTASVPITFSINK